MVGEWIAVGERIYKGRCIGCDQLVEVSFGEGVVVSNEDCKKEPGFCLLTQLGIESRIRGKLCQ